MKMFKKLIAVILLLCIVPAAAMALKVATASNGDGQFLQSDGTPWPFRLRFGSREKPKIAITMDDAYDLQYVWKTVELCRKYGIRMTFFPVGRQLFEEDAEHWQDLLDAGCEIGNHTFWHSSLAKQSARSAVQSLNRFQEQLDKVLGYHYPVRWVRPPYGAVDNEKGSAWAVQKMLKSCGYNNAILWDVSQTNPEKAAKAVRNGSILLYHARKKDYECLEKLIPVLLEKGFQPVTISELLSADQTESGSGS